MARRSLKPQLNQIRAWVRQGRTDAWIAHQLEVSAAELREFRSQHELTPDEENGGSKEVDLRDEIEAEVEAATAEEAATAAEEAAKEEESASDGDEAEEAEASAESADGEDGEAPPRRRRRRGRRGRGRSKEIEGSFDHGEQDGYGLWFDPSIKDSPVYAEHWAGKREIIVRIESDQIIIRRPGSPSGTEEEDSED
jgi:hypothetical protein